MNQVLPTFCKVGQLPPDQDETTIGLNPSKDHILLILKSIYKKRVFPAKKYAYFATKGGNFPFL